MSAITAGPSLAVETLHHPVRRNFDFFPPRIGEILAKEISFRIGLEAPDAVEAGGRGRVVGDAQPRSDISGFDRGLRRKSTRLRGKLCRGSYLTLQAHGHVDLENPLLISMGNGAPRFSAG